MLFAKHSSDREHHAAWIADDQALRGRATVHHVRDLSRSGADVCWYPWNIASPLPRTGAVVVTMHDVAPVALPDPRWLAWRKNWRWRRRYAATARRADMIVADSAFTAGEIHRVLEVPRDRIRVVHLAADAFAAQPARGDRATLARLGVRQPFVLSVGANDRRKNLDLLQRAMHAVVEALPNLTLVFAGPRGRPAWRGSDRPWWTRTLGSVSDDDLKTLYRSAIALAMPSTYEGFGLPVLEAMQTGTPVVCARASSLPEVAGDAALWFAPGDQDGLARAITTVATDARARERMREAGLWQAAKFSWDETARRTLDAFEDAMDRVAAPEPRP